MIQVNSVIRSVSSFFFVDNSLQPWKIYESTLERVKEIFNPDTNTHYYSFNGVVISVTDFDKIFGEILSESF